MKQQYVLFVLTTIDGKIKAWLDDLGGSQVDYNAPGLWCTKMAYSVVGTRSRFLAAGDEFQIKLWHMDNTNIQTAIDVEGSSLQASPRLRFNEDGSLFAVTTNDNGIKIIANAEGFHLIHMLESRSFEGTRVPPETMETKDFNCECHASRDNGNKANLHGNKVTAPGSLSCAIERWDGLPPALSNDQFSTFLVVHTQDNKIIAIGMEDSSIEIYNVRVDEVKTKLKGRRKKIRDLGFSHVLNVLICFGADAQLCLWGIDGGTSESQKLYQYSQEDQHHQWGYKITVS